MAKGTKQNTKTTITQEWNKIKQLKMYQRQNIEHIVTKPTESVKKNKTIKSSNLKPTAHDSLSHSQKHMDFASSQHKTAPERCIYCFNYHLIQLLIYF